MRKSKGLGSREGGISVYHYLGERRAHVDTMHDSSAGLPLSLAYLPYYDSRIVV